MMSERIVCERFKFRCKLDSLDHDCSLFIIFLTTGISEAYQVCLQLTYIHRMSKEMAEERSQIVYNIFNPRSVSIIGEQNVG